MRNVSEGTERELGCPSSIWGVTGAPQGPMLRRAPGSGPCSPATNLKFFGFFFFLRFFKFYFWTERKGGRRRQRETSVCGCFSHAPYWGPGPQHQHVPRLGIEPATLWFAGWCSIHRATPARA